MTWSLAQGDAALRFDEALYVVGFVLFLFKLFTLIDASARRKDAFVAADKQTKPFWLIILGLFTAADGIFAALYNGFDPLGILPIIGLIAAIVYVVDVRPALKQVTGGRKGGRGPSGRW
ncbi:hypothetical protein AQ490_02750 [Wenjunlia vitaminophila]|uniref:DUF2516 family protein n=1 Tax=Wenjunlia vitaminophila TaxID=76728 RepID=A0A0T6LYC9_WENVI|nr:DUF2516 family protein [Wenjunlia vitaminophila]KRV51131.1 hypothetical protein AQ490_02750 [Wenjunlia vitaminophila]